MDRIVGLIDVIYDYLVEKARWDNSRGLVELVAPIAIRISQLLSLLGDVMAVYKSLEFYEIHGELREKLLPNIKAMLRAVQEEIREKAEEIKDEDYDTYIALSEIAKMDLEEIAKYQQYLLIRQVKLERLLHQKAEKEKQE